MHIAATDAVGDPVTETRWVQHVADAAGVNVGIISAVELADADAPATLAAHARNPRFRGVRDVTAAQTMTDRSWQDGCRRLAALDGVCELAIPAATAEAVVDAAEAVPEVTFVVEHAAFPPPPVGDGYSEWVQHLGQLARADNVVCKISGLAMCDPHWRQHGIDQTVRHCLDAFGSTRCVVGTNWPVDSVVAGYTELTHAYQTAVAHLPDEQRAAVLSTNAQRLYRL